MDDVVAAEPARKINGLPLRVGGRGVGAMIVWIRLVENESVIVAGPEVALEGEVEAAIALRGTLA